MMATKEQKQSWQLVVQNVQQFSKSPFRRLKSYHLYIMRPQAGLLNLWDLADQTGSEQLLPQNPFGCLLDPVVVAVGARSWG